MKHSVKIPGVVARILYSQGYEIVDSKGKTWFTMGKKGEDPPDSLAPYKVLNDTADIESALRAAHAWKSCILVREDGNLQLRYRQGAKKWQRRKSADSAWTEVNPDNLSVQYGWFICSELEMEPKQSKLVVKSSRTSNQLLESARKPIRELRLENKKLKKQNSELQRLAGRVRA